MGFPITLLQQEPGDGDGGDDDEDDGVLWPGIAC